MPKRNESYTIRLAVENGRVVRTEFGQVGVTGEKAFKMIDSAGKGAKRTLGDLGSLVVTRLVPAFAALRLGRSILDNIQSFELLDNKIRGLSDGAEDYSQIQEFLKDKATELNVSIRTLTESYSELLALQKNGLLDRQDVNDLVVGFANIKAALGVDDNQIGQVLFGLSQALAAGTVRAQDFNQVVSPIPKLLGDMERAAGLSAGELRNLVNDGKLASDQFGAILIDALSDYGGAAEEMSDTQTAALTRLNNSWTELSRSLGEGGVTDSIVTTLDFLTGLNDAIIQGARHNTDYIKSAGTMETTVFSLSYAFKEMQHSTKLSYDILLAYREELQRFIGIAQQDNFVPNFTVQDVGDANPFVGLIEFERRLREQMSTLSQDSKDALDGSLSLDGSIDLEAPPVPQLKPDKIIAKGYDARKKAQEDAIKLLEREQQKIRNVIEALEFQSEQLRRNEREQAVHNNLKQAGVALDSEQAQKIRELTEANYDLQEAQRRSAEIQKEQLERLEEQTQITYDTINGITKAAIGGQIRSWEDLGDVVLNQMQNILISLTRLDNQGIGSLFGGGGISSIISGALGIFGGGSPSAIANPNIAGTSYLLPTYSEGGIATEPSIFGEGRMAEAAVPLPDGRTIPVTLSGGSTGGDTYVIDARGADKAGMERLLQLIKKLDGSIETRSLSAVRNEAGRNPNFLG